MSTMTTTISVVNERGESTRIALTESLLFIEMRVEDDPRVLLLEASDARMLASQLVAFADSLDRRVSR